MREIKFRAIYKNEMCEVSTIEFEARTSKIKTIGIIYNREYETIFVDEEDIILEQFTGLYDKNSKEIYEGDIVEAWSQGFKARGIVKQRIDGYWLMYPAWQNSEMWFLMPNDKGETTVKVIGNIHEEEK